MQTQHLARRSQCEWGIDAMQSQLPWRGVFSYLFAFTSCIKAKGYRTVTILSIRAPGAGSSVRGSRFFDRRLTCPRHLRSSFPFASWHSLLLAQRKKRHQCTSIQSQSRSSRPTPASTSKLTSGRTFRSAPTGRIRPLCAHPREMSA